MHFCPISEFFLRFYLIYGCEEFYFSEIMTTTFRTNSRDLYESMNRYFHNKRLPLMRLRDDEQFSMSILNLSNDETEKLIALLLKRFHLKLASAVSQAA